MAGAGRCDDITSGISIPQLVAKLLSIIGLSDRRVKRDIVAVDWSR